MKKRTRIRLLTAALFLSAAVNGYLTLAVLQLQYEVEKAAFIQAILLSAMKAGGGVPL